MLETLTVQEAQEAIHFQLALSESVSSRGAAYL
jgi:hypothetical protein